MRNILQKPHRCWIIICSYFLNIVGKSSLFLYGCEKKNTSSAFCDTPLTPLDNNSMSWRLSLSSRREINNFLARSCCEHPSGCVSGGCVRCPRIPNPKSQIPNPESRIPNPESHIAKTVLVRTSTVSQNHTVSFPFQNHTVSFPRSVRTTINIACVTPLLSYWFVSDRFLTG